MGGGSGAYTIPNTVTNIEYNAFMWCTALTGAFFQGQPPNAVTSVFANATNAIVYHLPGITGWGPTFADRPTALWKPQIRTTEPTFGVRTNQFSFNIDWASGMNIAVDACTSLTNPTWLPLQTNTMSADTFYFSDPDWTNSPRRFYRVRWPGPSAP